MPAASASPSAMADQAQSLPKIATRIEGLDDILCGGVPAGRTTLLSGGAGTGKSVFALELVYRHALAGFPALFISFEETAAAVRQNALTFGWDLASPEASGKLVLLDGVIRPDALIAGDFNLTGLQAIMEAQIREKGIDLIVIDAVDMLLRFFDDPHRRQAEIYGIYTWQQEMGITAVLTAKHGKTENNLDYMNYLEFMADCVFILDRRIQKQVGRRRLQILKFRGSPYAGNEHPFFISKKGIYIAPLSTLTMQYQTKMERLSSGNDRLDEILGGGYRTGTCIMVSGGTGTGKTCLANTFVASVCGRGQKVLYITYEESIADMKAGMSSLGIDLEIWIKNESLQILSLIPETMCMEEHFFHLARTIERFHPDHLIIDAVSAIQRIAGREAGFDFLIRLINLCRVKGITAFLINQASLFYEDSDISGIGISSIIDTLITMSYRHGPDRVDRVLLVLKSRGSSHSGKYYDYLLTGEGLLIHGEQKE